MGEALFDSMSSRLEELESILEYRFKNRSLLERALTHRSHSYEQSTREGGHQVKDNELLEFLGDAVLGLLVSEYLLERFPGENEGELSRLKSYLVSSNYLYKVAEHLKLGDFLLLGRGEELTGGRTKKTVLADALEALVGAVYLDGGLETARQLVRRYVIKDPAGLEEAQAAVHDYKGALQEFTQLHNLPRPEYRTVATSGPDHAKEFLVEVRVGEEFRAIGKGSSKRAAGKEAARKLFEELSARWNKDAEAQRGSVRESGESLRARGQEEPAVLSALELKSEDRC